VVISDVETMYGEDQMVRIVVLIHCNY